MVDPKNVQFKNHLGNLTKIKTDLTNFEKNLSANKNNYKLFYNLVIIHLKYLKDNFGSNNTIRYSVNGLYDVANKYYHQVYGNNKK